VYSAVGDDLSLNAALDRLSASLADNGQEFASSLRPPASDHDLDELRRAIDPYEIPLEVVSLLRWHDGQGYRPEPDPPWLLPIESGPLLGASEAAKAYLFLRDETEPWQWCPLWLPIVQHRWWQLAVEIAADAAPGVVIDGDFGAPEVRIKSSSLAALLHATADMAETGRLRPPPSGPDYARWHAEREELIEARADQAGWTNWPYARTLPHDEQASHWPPRWRAARGLPVPEATT
jgi:hypothetical protein